MKGACEDGATKWTDLPQLPLPDSLRPSSPTDADVHLWLIDLGATRQTIQTCRQVLSPDEQERAERFRFQHLRDRFTITRGAVRQTLAAYLDTPPATLRFTYGPQGKPSLTEESRPHHLTFNISHSQNLAILAVAKDRRIGIDLEHREEKQDLDQIATRNFTQKEAAAIASLSLEQRTGAFYACWTLKEAYLKALGDGLSTPLDSFDVHFPPTHVAALAGVTLNPSEHLRWQAHSFTLGDHAVALIVEGQRHTVHRAVWNPDSRTG